MKDWGLCDSHSWGRHVPIPAAATVEGSGNPSLSPEPREPQLGWLFIGLFAPSLPLLLNGGALGG